MATTSSPTPVVFLYPKQIPRSALLFIAAFIAQHGRQPVGSANNGLIPIHASQKTGRALMSANKNFKYSFEFICRALSDEMSTKQATNPFFLANSCYVIKVPKAAISLYGTGRLVDAAQLTVGQNGLWNSLDEDQKKSLLAEAEAVLDDAEASIAALLSTD